MFCFCHRLAGQIIWVCKWSESTKASAFDKLNPVVKSSLKFCFQNFLLFKKRHKITFFDNKKLQSPGVKLLCSRRKEFQNTYRFVGLFTKKPSNLWPLLIKLSNNIVNKTYYVILKSIILYPSSFYQFYYQQHQPFFKN